MSFIKRIVKANNFILFVVFVAIVVIFQILSGGSFLTVVNIRNLLNSTVVVTLLAVGAGFLIISGHIDLSAGYTGTLCGMLIAYLIMRVEVHWIPAFFITLVVAMVVGFINATLIHKLRFQSFIATLAMGMVCGGLAYLVNNGDSIPIRREVADAFINIGTSRIYDTVPSSVLIAIAALIIYGIILSKTRFGRKVFMIGGNPTAAHLSGINSVKISYALFINNAALACMAGSLVAARTLSGQIGGTTAQNFSGITAAILGGVSFGGGSGSISGIILGLLIISSFDNGLRTMRVGVQWSLVGSGLLLLLALTLDYLRSDASFLRRRKKRAG